MDGFIKNPLLILFLGLLKKVVVLVLPLVIPAVVETMAVKFAMLSRRKVLEFASIVTLPLGRVSIKDFDAPMSSVVRTRFVPIRMVSWKRPLPFTSSLYVGDVVPMPTFELSSVIKKAVTLSILLYSLKLLFAADDPKLQIVVSLCASRRFPVPVEVLFNRRFAVKEPFISSL